MGIDCTGMGGSGNVKSHSRASLVPGISNSHFSHGQFLTNFEVKIFICIVHLMCVFHYLRILAVS